MPELPEVETIKLGLQRKIVGLTIKSVEILNPKTFQGDPKLLEGKKVIEVWRRAKILGIDLGSGQSSVVSRQIKNKKNLTAESCRLMTLLFHLKMTGQLILDQKSKIKNQKLGRIIGGHPTPDMRDQMPNKSTRVIFTFDNPLRPRSEASGSKLYFNDQRKFGWVKIVQSAKIKDQSEKVLGKLGPEPFDPSFTWEILKNNLLKHKKMPIKVAIMDQSVIAGVGNIYASESLFDAKLDPQKKVAELSDEEFKKLYEGIKKALATGIKHGGSTRANFVNVDGERGYFLDYASVYGKEGQDCKGCPGKVEKITQAGRGTYFCPSCQK